MFLQLDELWSYCRAKSNKLLVFIGFEASAKFWINFELGSRTQCTAHRLVRQIRDFGNFSQKRVLRLTTDKFAAYQRVIAEVFFDIPYRYWKIVKKRVKMKLATVKKVFVKGTSRSFPKNVKKLKILRI
jgi:hypothetical protein